jgi:hypothetical protein
VVVSINSVASSASTLTYLDPAAVTSVSCTTVNGAACSTLGANVPMSGALITVVGTLFPASFPAAVSVTVDSVACTPFTVASATQLTCTAPARTSGAGTGYTVNVVVAGQTNTWTTSTVTLTYRECMWQQWARLHSCSVV